jgi:hypothetical protein
VADGASVSNGVVLEPASATGRRPGRRWRIGLVWIALACLNFLLFAPSFVYRQGHQDFFPSFRISYEFGLFLVALALASRIRGAVLARAAAGVRVLGVAAYALLLLFLTYDSAIPYFFQRTPALWEDWRLIVNLVHYVGDFPSMWLSAVTVGAGVLLLLALFAMERLLARFQQWARTCSMRPLASGSLSFVLLGGLSVGWFGTKRDDAVIQLLGARVAENYRVSKARIAAVGDLAGVEPDLRYEALMNVELARRPNVYLLMIEAYGEVLATCDTRAAYQSLLGRIEARLTGQGFSARTAYSRAPVHAGWSWLSIGTVQTGIRIDEVSSYSMLELVGARIPSLTSFFRAQGYWTMALQPANRDRTGIRRLDVFNRHQVIEAPELRYHGPEAHWAAIPDEYSLGYFRENYLSGAPEPRFVFYMSVSTHHPFKPIPYVGDWRAWNSPGFPAALDEPAWPPLEGVQLIATEARRNYLATIEYEWRLLADFIEAEGEKSPDAIFIVLGDHQPRLDCESSPTTFHTPVHVVSKDAAFVARFSDVGFSRGLFAEPGARLPLLHEGLFSLFVTQLAEHNAFDDGSSGCTYYPSGIGLAGLMR